MEKKELLSPCPYQHDGCEFEGGRVTLYHHVKFRHKSVAKSLRPPNLAGQYKCQFCRETFETEADREAHKGADHTTGSCEYCSKQFATRKSLIKHRITEHLDRATHVCDICMAPYFNQRGYDQHRKKCTKKA